MNDRSELANSHSAPATPRGAPAKITKALVQKLVSTRYEDLPVDVIDAARGAVLDGLSNMLAGSREPLAAPLVDYIRSLGGPQDATVVGHGFKTHPVHAAFANGAMCHSMDFELMWMPPTHPTGTSLPAILALAQQRELPAKDIVLALVLAFEVQGRLRLCTTSGGPVQIEGMHPPGLVGPFGAAAGATRLLNLDAQHTAWALGIAGSRACGLSANTGTMTKSTHSGNAARMGLEAALLAERGFTGSEEIFEGKRGFNDVLFHGALDMNLLVENFGAPYRMMSPGLIVKRFPCQYTNHWLINAALNIRAAHRLHPESIERVEIEAASDNPSLGRNNPATGLDGKFSSEYTVAIALLDGEVVIDSFRDDRRFAPDVVALLPRITAKPNREIRSLEFGDTWARVTVWTRDGARYSDRVDRPLGIWDNPLPWEGRVQKFYDCAKRVLSREQAAGVLQLIERFEHLDSVRPLMDRVAAGGG